MPTGRCAGCGLTGPRTRIETHVLECPGYLALFRGDPRRCLDPGAEHARFRDADTSAAKACRRDDRLRDRFADTAAAQARSARRWITPPDILAD